MLMLDEDGVGVTVQATTLFNDESWNVTARDTCSVENYPEGYEYAPGAVLEWQVAGALGLKKRF